MPCHTTSAASNEGQGLLITLHLKLLHVLKSHTGGVARTTFAQLGQGWCDILHLLDLYSRTHKFWLVDST